MNPFVKKYQLSKIEKFIIGSMIILPYTLLRFGIMGFGEVYFIWLFIYVIQRPIITNWINSFHFSRFWVFYLLVSFFGFIYNVVFLKHATGTFEGMLFDFGAFIIVLMTCFSLENLIKRGRINTYAILRNIFLVSSIAMVILFVISLYTDAIFGISLKYYHYFVPLADNLHQISMSLVPLPFIGLKVFSVEKKWWMRLIVVILLFMDAYMAFNTGSTKAYLSVYSGAFSFLILYVYFKFQRKSRILLLVLVLSIFVSAAIYYREQIATYAIGYFIDNDLESGRQILYTDALKIGVTSPFIGLGTGVHIWEDDKFWDVHQSFLAAFLHAGIIGVILLTNIFYKTLKRNLKEPAIFAAIIAILLYALGGDILRRLPMWVFMVLFFYYNKKDESFFGKFKTKYRLIFKQQPFQNQQ